MSNSQCAPRMIDLRFAPAATATWAATWWATGHRAPWESIGACAILALACAASYACSHRGRKAPRHALTPPRSARLGLAAPWVVLLLLSGGGASASVWNSPGGIAVLCSGAGVCVIAYLIMKAMGRLSTDPRNLGGAR